MGSVKKSSFAALVLIVTGTVAVAKDNLHFVFAGCVGRMSAEMEHAWLMNSTEATALEQQRAVFLSLLDATREPDITQAALALRIQTKQAHSSLLSKASFAQDETLAEHAAQAANAYILACEMLLLDS